MSGVHFEQETITLFPNFVIVGLIVVAIIGIILLVVAFVSGEGITAVISFFLILVASLGVIFFGNIFEKERIFNEIKTSLVPELEEYYDLKIEPKAPAFEALYPVNFQKDAPSDAETKSKSFEVVSGDKLLIVFATTNQNGLVTLSEVTSDGAIKELTPQK